MTRLRSRSAAPVAAVLAWAASLLLAAPPAAAQAAQERLPTELWQEYPLNPNEESEEAEETEQAPALTVRTQVSQQEEAPARPARAQGDAVPADEEGTRWMLLVGVTLGVSAAVGILLGILLAVRGRPGRGPGPAGRALALARAAGGRRVRSFPGPAGGPAAPVARRRSAKEGPEELRWRSGAIAAYTRGSGEPAEPAAAPRPLGGDEPLEEKPSGPKPATTEAWAREGAAAAKPPKPPQRGAKKVVHSGVPPRKKELPGVSPPRKARPVTSGLPARKAVPREESRVPPVLPPPPSGEAQPSPRPAPAPSGPRYVEVGWEECQIEHWASRSASGALSDFYALAGRPGGESYVAAVSQPFKWGRSDPPGEVGETADAHEALVDLLLAEGWEPAGRGAAWYQRRFRRRLVAPESSA